jgi:DNA polymerase-3 subunit gamma/tau
VHHLSRAWSLLAKSYDELHLPAEAHVLEMAILRLLYSAHMPSIAGLMEQMRGRVGVSLPSPMGFVPPPVMTAFVDEAEKKKTLERSPAQLYQPFIPNVASPMAVEQHTRQETIQEPPKTYEAMIVLLGQAREIRLKTALEKNAHLVDFALGRISLRFAGDINATMLMRELSEVLNRLTGLVWSVGLSSEQGEPTLFEKKQKSNADLKLSLMDSSLVKTTFDVFPQASIVAVRDLAVEITAVTEIDSASSQAHASDTEVNEEED